MNDETPDAIESGCAAAEDFWDVLQGSLKESDAFQQHLAAATTLGAEGYAIWADAFARALTARIATLAEDWAG